MPPYSNIYAERFRMLGVPLLVLLLLRRIRPKRLTLLRLLALVSQCDPVPASYTLYAVPQMPACLLQRLYPALRIVMLGLDKTVGRHGSSL